MVMGIKREKLLSLLEPDNLTPSLSYWISFLNFFEQNIDDLDIADMRIICDECEKCRQYLNQDRERTIMIFRNGHEMELKQIDPGLGIAKEDVFPKIYDHLEMLEKQAESEIEEEEDNWSTDVIQINTPTHEEVIPLAAAPMK